MGRNLFEVIRKTDLGDFASEILKQKSRSGCGRSRFFSGGENPAGLRDSAHRATGGRRAPCW